MSDEGSRLLKNFETHLCCSFCKKIIGIINIESLLKNIMKMYPHLFKKRKKYE